MRSYRLAAGLSQEALAERARMSVNGVGALERGDRRSPQRETLALLAQALALEPGQRRAFEAAAERPSLVRAASRPNNLPLALTSFVGRETEVGEIAALVRSHRLVTLTGTGGIGKTRTALEIAALFHEDTSDEVWFVELARAAEPSLVAAAIASTLGVQEIPDKPLLETLRTYLNKKSLLLVLDNCEHVVGEVARVADTLLRGAPGLRVLATSREALRVSGEHTYGIPALATPSLDEARGMRAAEAAAYSAIVLFTERARAVDLRFVLTDENAPAVAEICRRLDGISLAIELAAARVKILPVKTLSAKLDQRFAVLTGGDRTALPRHQTMRALIDWSYDLLTPQEQWLFERLSVFAGGCTLATATAVLADELLDEADVLELLSSLVDKSLVVADFETREPRYRMLESARAYAREKLDDRGETNVVARRHAVAYLQQAEALGRAYESEHDRVWRRTAQEESDNWRAALEWSLAGRNDVALGRRLAGELNLLWTYFARLEGQRWIAAARQHVDEHTPLAVIAKLDYAEARIALQLFERRVQYANSEKALSTYRALGDERSFAQAQALAGHALLALGERAEALPQLEEALTIARRLDMRQLTAWLLHNVAFASAAGGDFAQARSYDGEALAIYRELGATGSAARIIAFDLSVFEFWAGNTGAAITRAGEALAMFRAIDDAEGTAMTLTNMAAWLVSLDRYDEAEVNAREALELARTHPDGDVVWPLQELGDISALRPRATKEDAYAACVRSARLMGFVDVRMNARGVVRWVTGQREYDRVITVLREVLGAEGLADRLAAGALMSEDEAIEEALRA